MKKVKVIVLAERFGAYKKGDELEMEHSTALAVSKSKKVKVDGEPDESDVDTKVNSTDAISHINTLNTVAEIDDYIVDETRKGVLKAAEDRKAELSK